MSDPDMYRLCDSEKEKDPSKLKFSFSIYYANQLKKESSFHFFQNKIPKQIRKYVKKCKRATSNIFSNLYEKNSKRFSVYGSETLLNSLSKSLRFFKAPSCLCDAVLVSECYLPETNEIIVNGFATFYISKSKKKKTRGDIKLSIVAVDKNLLQFLSQ